VVLVPASIEGQGIKIPAIFDIFITIIGLAGTAISIYLYWSQYLKMNETNTNYGIFIGALFSVSASFFIFGAKTWKKRHDKEVEDAEEKRKLELGRMKLENQKIKKELKNKRKKR
jgi:hypothetical protein